MPVTKSSLNTIMIDFFRATLYSILNPFNYFLRKYEAIPFAFSEPARRFRTTVQATCLLSLSRASLLNRSEERTLQQTIVSMKDSWLPFETDLAGGLDPPQKYSEDKNAWCVTETPSVWSTSYAIWSLLSSGYQDETHIWPAIEWLVSQQDEQTGGFAYQKYKDCIPTVYLTCLAIKALRAILRNLRLLEKKQELIPILKSTIGRGMDFILSCSWKMNGTTVFTQHLNVPKDKFDWISTIWGYRTLSQNNHPSAPNPQPLFSLLQKEIEDETKLRDFWRFNAFVIESHTKYGEQKTYFYFMPSLLIPLINLGLNPLDPLCAYFLKELKKTFRKAGWPIAEYRKTELCTFSTALALQTIYTWASRVPVAAMTNLLSETKQIDIEKDKISQLERYKERYEKLKQRLLSLVAFIPALILLLVVPWRNWFSSKKAFFTITATIEVVLCLVGIRLLLRPPRRLWRLILEIIGLLAGVATLVYVFFGFH